MAMLKKSTFIISLILIQVCSSKKFNGDYFNGNGISSPFDSGSGIGSVGSGSQTSTARNNGNGFGRNPFSTTGKAEGSFPNAHSNNNGVGKSPFSAAVGNAIDAGPFASAASNVNGRGDGTSPFSGATPDKGSSPFKENMDGNGVDLSSLMKSGPGGLTGGNFQTHDNSLLTGHDFSKDLTENGGQFGDIGSSQGQIENKIGIDNSRFDTSAYQQMLQDLFSTDNPGHGMNGMGTPFDGNSYNYNTNNEGTYRTDKEISLGSFASTDMSYYSGGTDTGYQKFQNLKKGQNMGNGTSFPSNTYSNPFDVQNYDTEKGLFSNGEAGKGTLSMNTHERQNPFSIKNSVTGKTPFSVDRNSLSNYANSAETGSGPFDTSKFGMSNSNLHTNSYQGQNPFDTSKYQASGAVNSMMGNQNVETGSTNYNTGQDSYVNFGKLSGFSDNSVYNGAKTGMGSTYTGAGAGYNSGSESQYETPFETDNYNNLLDNPFKSDSYFDTTKQNFKQPYETNSKLQQSGYSNFGTSSDSYTGNGYVGSGPGGDPFHQGGKSMVGSSSLRGR